MCLHTNMNKKSTTFVHIYILSQSCSFEWIHKKKNGCIYTGWKKIVTEHNVSGSYIWLPSVSWKHLIFHWIGIKPWPRIKRKDALNLKSLVRDGRSTVSQSSVDQFKHSHRRLVNQRRQSTSADDWWELDCTRRTNCPFTRGRCSASFFRLWYRTCKENQHIKLIEPTKGSTML